jgi:hypothetical protein
MAEIILKESALIDEVYRAATYEGKAVVDFVEDAVRRELETYRQRRIWAEGEAWYKLPLEIRNQYRSKYVAVFNGKIVDSDPSRRALYARIHERYDNEPVLIVEGGDAPLPTYNVRNVLTTTLRL